MVRSPTAFAKSAFVGFVFINCVTPPIAFNKSVFVVTFVEFIKSVSPLILVVKSSLLGLFVVINVLSPSIAFFILVFSAEVIAATSSLLIAIFDVFI